MKLAEKLTIQRKKSGMSQEQLADRLGITRQSVSKWEAGSSVPEISKLIALSELFQVSLDYLLKDYLDEENERLSAENSDRDWRQEGQKRSENRRAEDSRQQEDNLRLEEMVDELTRYIRGFQYTSKTKIMGIPLVSVRFSRHPGRDGVAKGIIAIGNFAIGVISIGAGSVGIISFGAISLGILTIGALAVGVAAWGALAVGVITFGATALGVYSAGVVAVGKEIAVGVSAIGKTAIGETVTGEHCLNYERGVTTGLQIKQFIDQTNPHLWKPLKDILTMFAEHI